MRIFRLVKTWKELLKLVLTVLDSLEAIANLGVLMMLFLFMVALLMKQFYGVEPYIDGDGEASRYRFDTTIRALITVFVVLTGENWN
jgi:hypothetical protein